MALTTLPATAQMSARIGDFVATADHTATGKAIIVQGGGQYIVRLTKDFAIDGADDVVVGLGKDGSYHPETLLGVLDGSKGAHLFPVPASIQSEDFNEVYIWSRSLDAPVAVALLNTGPNQ